MKGYINGITHSGEGVARIDGKATFIPYAIPGETVEVEITQEKKNYRRARLIKVLDCSPHRIAPLCPHYYDCGGCAFQHISYPRQLELKQRIVQDSMKRIGKITFKVNPVLGMEEPWRYRNKVTWHVDRINGRLKMGYYQNYSHKTIDITTCKLIAAEMEGLSLYLKDILEEINLPEHCKAVIRRSSFNQKLMLVFKGEALNNLRIECLCDYPELESIWTVNDKGDNTLLYGEPCLQEAIDELHFRISALSFLQVNPVQTRILYNLVKKYADTKRSDRVLDAYCGIGTISLMLSQTAGKVVGIESFAPAVDDAMKNKNMNNINNCDFVNGDCEIILPRLTEEFDLVVLDPPRAGCSEELIRAISAQSPPKIIYVSCNPATLARDLALFINEGYEIQAIQPVDMFPQTSHVECVTLMSRVKE